MGTLLFFMKINGNDEEVSSNAAPLLVCGIASYFTANLFLGMMDEAVLALLTCLCIDRGINDGEPKFGPKTFHDDDGPVKKMGNEMKEGGDSDRFNKPKA